jgi:CubicO group peptidase (beta-lactamase class C family)
MLPRDMAKIGYLYLRNGEWEGKPLLPPSWIYQVSHATVNMNQKFLDIIFSLHPSSILHQINLSARRLAWPPRPTMM